MGAIILGASDLGLCGVWFEGQRYGPTQSDICNWVTDASHGVLKDAERQLMGYFSGASQCFDVPLDLSQGTPFQQSVWRALLSIPSGQCLSYGELARQMNLPRAVRAVAGAVGRNPVSIMVPCHRVIGASGQLTGYAGGLWRKQALLKIESPVPGALVFSKPLQHADQSQHS